MDGSFLMAMSMKSWVTRKMRSYLRGAFMASGSVNNPKQVAII